MLLIAWVWHYTQLCTTVASRSRKVMLTNQGWPKRTISTRIDYYIQLCESPLSLSTSMLLRVGDNCRFDLHVPPTCTLLPLQPRLDSPCKIKRGVFGGHRERITAVGGHGMYITLSMPSVGTGCWEGPGQSEVAATVMHAAAATTL